MSGAFFCGQPNSKNAELTCLADRADFLRSEAVKRRRGHPKQAQIQINLAAVMHFMFNHSAQPFGGLNFDGAWRFAFAL
jgi:hypothetical protein